jgi:hypothetical protein
LDAKGLELGRTPWVHERKAASGEFVLSIHHDGYLDAAVAMDQSASAARRFALTRKPTSTGKKSSARAGSQPSPGAGKKSGKISYED